SKGPYAGRGTPTGRRIPVFVGGIRRSIGVVLLGIALFVGFARPPHAAQQSTSDAQATLTADVNQERTSRGLGSLTAASDLAALASPAPATQVATRTLAAPAAPAPASPPTPAAAPPTTAASPSTSTSLVAAAVEQWPPASVLAAHQSANSESPDSTLQALAVVAALLLLLVAGVEVAAVRRRIARP